MKKIMLVTDAWAPQVSGVVRVQNALIRSLEARGYEVLIIEPSQFFTVKVPFYPEVRLALFARRRVARMIQELRPDAIHLMIEGPLGWAARKACMRAGIPFTTWYHTHFQLYLDMHFRGLLPVVSWVMHRFHKPAARTLVSTEGLKREVEAMGFKHIVVAPLGVDTKLFTRNPTPTLPPLPKPVFVFFSRLAMEKSPEEFLKLELPGTKLVIGDGPDRAKLEAEYGMKNKFVGYKSGQELIDWLSLTDVLVFPSRTETFGLIALEALACGIPVAAHNVLGPRDIIVEGKTGYLGEDLRVAALKCLDLSSTDCRAAALEYSWENSTEAFLRSLVFIH
jgi:glycosyltransferase involved in cell wall biosynthesis